MRKFLVFLLILLLSVLLAGAYGALHNQISYTVSAEYFSKFKFIQFGLEQSPLPNRLKISIIGILASWWMGIPLGIALGCLGFIHHSAKRMFVFTLQAIGITIAVTLMVNLIGLGYGYIQTQNITFEGYTQWFIPEHLDNPKQFLRAGYMHNSAYLGGLLGGLCGCVYQIVRRRWQR